MIHADVRGEIRIDDQLLTAIDLEQLSPAIGLVQQDPDAQVCTLRVHSEVAFGPQNLCLPPQEIETRVTQALGSLGIAHLTGRDTTSLSGGEKQRLAVASILAMRPSVILLDEPTAHLDPAGARDLFNLLRKLQQEVGCTLLIVEHRLPPLRTLEPQLWIMDSGHLVERNVARVHEDVASLTRKVAVDRSVPTHDKTSQGVLRVEHLSFGYQERLLEDLTFTLTPGMILGVIGPNGAGKTTLLRLMAALERPTEGSIVRPDDMTAGMVFQHPHQQIFERTVRRDLEIEGPLDEEHLFASLASARLSGLADVPPQSLSLGEQRRLTVLAALRGAPDLLLLDEPFIGQDRDNVAWIVGQIRQARDRGAMTIFRWSMRCVIVFSIWETGRSWGHRRMFSASCAKTGVRPLRPNFGRLQDDSYDCLSPWKPRSSSCQSRKRTASAGMHAVRRSWNGQFHRQGWRTRSCLWFSSLV